MHDTSAGVHNLSHSGHIPDGSLGPPSGDWMSEALHDLCQPLTALQCRLYLGTLAAEDGDHAGCVEALRESLLQCERVMEQVRAMQHAQHPDQPGQHRAESAQRRDGAA